MDGSAIVTDSFDRTTFLGFLAARLFVRIFRLFVDERITAVVIALEIIGRRFPAQVTINALVVYVIFSSVVFRVFICDISHKILPLAAPE
jgi:hypothetical protein